MKTPPSPPAAPAPEDIRIQITLPRQVLTTTARADLKARAQLRRCSETDLIVSALKRTLAPAGFTVSPA